MAAEFGRPGEGPRLASDLLGRVTEIIVAAAEPMPGAHEIVERIAAVVPVAVASNSPRALLDAALAHSLADPELLSWIGSW